MNSQSFYVLICILTHILVGLPWYYMLSCFKYVSPDRGRMLLLQNAHPARPQKKTLEGICKDIEDLNKS